MVSYWYACIFFLLSKWELTRDYTLKSKHVFKVYLSLHKQFKLTTRCKASDIILHVWDHSFHLFGYTCTCWYVYVKTALRFFFKRLWLHSRKMYYLSLEAHKMSIYVQQVLLKIQDQKLLTAYSLFYKTSVIVCR